MGYCCAPAPHTRVWLFIRVYCLSWVFWMAGNSKQVSSAWSVLGVGMGQVCLDTAPFSIPSVLAGAYFVLFNAEVVGDGSGSSCPSSLMFPALNILPASRSSFSEVKALITPHCHVLCCEILLECCVVACEKSSVLCKSLSWVKG